MASDEVQPVTAQQPIEGELNVLISMSEKQILSLISATHLPDEENFDADSLLVAVEHEHQKYRENYFELLGSDEEDMENLEGKMSIASFKNEEDEENPKEKGQENLEEKESRDSFNPQLLRILKQLSSEMACEAPSMKVIMAILNKLSNYSWEAKLLLILAAYGLNYEDFLDIPNNVPATLKHQKLQEIFSFSSAIIHTLDIMKYFLKVKKVTKDEPVLLSDVAGDIPVGVYWIIVTCTTHMGCLSSDEDKTQDLSPLVNKIWSIFFDLERRLKEVDEKYRRRKLKELFPKDAMQPLIDGSTNEQVSIDVLKEKNIILFISGLNIHRKDKLDFMSIYDGIKKKGDHHYKIVWIPIVERWTNSLRRKFEMLRSKMPWYIVQYFSAVAAIKFIEGWYDNKPIVLLMNPQGELVNEIALESLDLIQQFEMSDLIQQFEMRTFPFTLIEYRAQAHSAYGRTSGPHETEKYTFLCGGKDKQWIEQFSRKVNVVAQDRLIQEFNIDIKVRCVGKDRRQLNFGEEIQELLPALRKERRWAVLMTNFSEVISKDGTTIEKVLEEFENWKVNVREIGFQNCFEEYHRRLLPTGSQPSAWRNV